MIAKMAADRRLQIMSVLQAYEIGCLFCGSTHAAIAVIRAGIGPGLIFSDYAKALP